MRVFSCLLTPLLRCGRRFGFLVFRGSMSIGIFCGVPSFRRFLGGRNEGEESSQAAPRLKFYRHGIFLAFVIVSKSGSGVWTRYSPPTPSPPSIPSSPPSPTRRPPPSHRRNVPRVFLSCLECLLYESLTGFLRYTDIDTCH
jgi:hypothetical protein